VHRTVAYGLETVSYGLGSLLRVIVLSGLERDGVVLRSLLLVLRLRRRIVTKAAQLIALAHSHAAFCGA